VPPTLEYELGGQRQVVPLAKDEITIGRAPENDLVIHDASISRFHAKIFREGGDWRIVDVGSKNGTHVNDVGNSNAALRDGDEILLGKFPVSFTDNTNSANVALTSHPPGPRSVMDDASGTIIRSAVDFSSLASQPVPNAARAGSAEIERLRKLFSIVTEVSGSLLGSLPLEDMLQKVLDLVFEHLPVERACILLWDDKRKELVPRTTRARGEKSQPDMKISRTIAEKVFNDKVAVLTMDAQQDPRFAGGASIMALGIRSAMAAPLWNGERVDGIIYVDTPLHVKAFDDSDLDLLSALGNHAAIAIEQSRLQDSILREQLGRQRLERYHSPAVIERITRMGGEVESLAAEERDVTVLFADAVGFTDRCEHTEPRAVAELLNKFFSRMSEMVFRHEGTLDKFIGDCLMAVYGAPFEMEDHAARGVQSALDMMKALNDLNDELPLEDRVAFRMGIHSGRVVAGDIGSARRSDYTVLGATVNLAARLQGSVAEAGQIIVSDATREAAGTGFRMRPMGEFQPKGISRSVKCFEVIGVEVGEDTLSKR
jgi:adenylate cyclase